MALGVLCLGLSLLGILQSQAKVSAQNLIPAPSLDKVSLQPNFQHDKVGAWKGCCRRSQEERGAEGKRSRRFPGQHWVGWLGFLESRVQASAHHHPAPQWEGHLILLCLDLLFQTSIVQVRQESL